MGSEEKKEIIKVTNLFKEFQIGERENQVNQVLKELNLSVKAGEFVIIFGPSGCGKTTFLNCLIGLEVPTKGKITILGKDITNLTDDQRAAFRSKEIGVVYQLPYWIKALTVVENVALPLTIAGYDEAEALEKAEATLKEVGLAKRISYMPTELSGGEQQRVGLARALIGNTKIIVADEPTGNLDVASGQRLMGMLRQLNKEQKRTIILVTHNLDYLRYASRKIAIEDGRIIGDTSTETGKIVARLEKKVRLLKEEEKKIVK